MRVWDAQAGECMHVLKQDSIGGVQEVAFVRNGQLCFSSDSSIHVWDTVTWQKLAKVVTFVGHNALAISHDGSYIAGSNEIYAAQSWKDTLSQAAIEKAESIDELEKIRASKTMRENKSTLAPRIAGDLQEKLNKLQSNSS